MLERLSGPRHWRGATCKDVVVGDKQRRINPVLITASHARFLCSRRSSSYPSSPLFVVVVSVDPAWNSMDALTNSESLLLPSFSPDPDAKASFSMSTSQISPSTTLMRTNFDSSPPLLLLLIHYRHDGSELRIPEECEENTASGDSVHDGGSCRICNVCLIFGIRSILGRDGRRGKTVARETAKIEPKSGTSEERLLALRLLRLSPEYIRRACASSSSPTSILLHQFSLVAHPRPSTPLYHTRSLRALLRGCGSKKSISRVVFPVEPDRLGADVGVKEKRAPRAFGSAFTPVLMGATQESPHLRSRMRGSWRGFDRSVGWGVGGHWGRAGYGMLRSVWRRGWASASVPSAPARDGAGEMSVRPFMHPV
ncbi:hypothetical protein R3P38DRAFT_2794886 [Favolaschia claudopus]|uniref:Uncharacterized protein n=1 Tax=Favolaschia claudopus TaxID=2862362 RepID=A0AAW0A862_9AGAR